MNRFEWVRHNAEEPILDVGCGDSKYFNEDVKYIGVDNKIESEDMVEDRPERFILADGIELPFSENEFQTVILAEVLEHVDNPIAVMMEAKRVSKQKILITVPDEYRWLPQAEPGEHEEHKRIYTGDKLVSQLAIAGLDRDDIKVDHLNDFPFVFWLAECSVN